MRHSNDVQALVIVTLALVTLTACVDGGMAPRAPTPGVPWLRVATFNVLVEAHSDSETIEAIGRTEADVIALQEVDARWEVNLRARYGEVYPHMLFHHPERATGGLAVLSRFPLEDGGVQPGFEGWHPSWHVVADSPVGPLQLVVVHLRPPLSPRDGVLGSYFVIDEKHQQEIEQIIEPCQEELATIVLGDFNESIDGGAVRWLEARGFTNALPLFRPGQETWRYEKSFLGQTIDTLDHVLFDEQMAPLDARVLYEGNSDHLPVVVDLELAQ